MMGVVGIVVIMYNGILFITRSIPNNDIFILVYRFYIIHNIQYMIKSSTIRHYGPNST